MPGSFMSGTYSRFKIKCPKLPPRSRLYNLEPVGVGSPFVESLTSYLAREAQAHCLSVSMLFGYELAPQLDKEYLKRAAARLKYPCQIFASTFRPLARAMNGLGKGASEWVHVMQSLTLRSDLRFLTLLPWAGLLSQDQLLRPTRAWCAVCYDEWLERGETVYEPLLWAIKAVTVCHLHKLPLRTACDHCKKTLHPLSSRSRPGQCAWCGAWLGAPVDKVGIDKLTAEDIDREVWISSAIGELLAAAPALNMPPERKVALKTLEIWLGAHLGDLPSLAKPLRVNKTTVWQWSKGTYMPRLDLLLRLCNYFRVPLLNILTGKAKPTRDVNEVCQRNRPDVVSLRRERVQLDGEEIRRILTSALGQSPPPSLQEVAARVERDGNTLRYRFKDLCKAVVERYSQYRKIAREKKWREVEKALNAELGKESPVSMAAVARRIDYDVKSLTKRYPELCKAISTRHTESCRAKWDKVRIALQDALADDYPPSLISVAKRLGLSKTSLYARLPHLCQEISARFCSHRKTRQAVS